MFHPAHFLSKPTIYCFFSIIFKKVAHFHATNMAFETTYGRETKIIEKEYRKI